MVADLSDPAALEAAREAHAQGYLNAIFLAFAGIVGSHVNAPVIEAKRYADARRRGRKPVRRPRALPPARERAPVATASRGGSAEDDLLDTFRW